jgi:tyrosyl-tRNA synthetase
MQLLLRISDQERAALLAGHPRQAKAALAHGITAFLHGSAAADQGREAFDSQFRDGNLPDDIPEFAWPSDEADLPLMVVLAQVGLAATSSEARRLIGQGAVRIDGEVCNDVKARLQAAESSVLVQVGKRRFGRVAARLMA